MTDLGVAHDLNAWATRHDGFEDAFSTYASASEALFLLLLVALFVAVFGSMRTLARRAAVGAGASVGVALLIAQVLSRVVDRPRPFVAHPDLIHLFAPHAADPSFPSDHTTAAFAIATAIFLRNRVVGAVTLAAAAILGFTRVLIGVHYPLDVLGGAAIGAAAALALYAPPLRRPTDRAADALGAAFDATMRRAGGLVGLGR